MSYLDFVHPGRSLNNPEVLHYFVPKYLVGSSKRCPGENVT